MDGDGDDAGGGGGCGVAASAVQIMGSVTVAGICRDVMTGGGCEVVGIIPLPHLMSCISVGER